MSDVLQAVKIMKETGMLRPGAHGAATTSPNAPARVTDAEVIENPQTVRPKVEVPIVATNPIVEGVKKYVPIFLSRAKRNHDVEDMAGFLLDELNDEIVPLICANYRPGGLSLTPEFVLQNLIEKSQDPNEVNKIFAFAPELAPYRPWVEAVIASAVKELTEPDAAPENSPVG